MSVPRLEVRPVLGVPEVRAGNDLAGLLLEHLDEPLRDGDVVTVTSKVVAKAAGLVVPGTRDEAVGRHTERVVARRGATAIIRTRHRLTLAAAGVDASNVPAGHVVPLPDDPDAVARDLRAALGERTGRRLGVVVTDTAGRAWRTGQTDIAVGVAGLAAVTDLTGQRDRDGNVLTVTMPAVADEVAAAAELVCGKSSGRPFAVVRGLEHLVIDHDGPGAAALIRPEEDDLFGWGATDAVGAALALDDTGLAGFASWPGTPRHWAEDAVAAARPGLGVRIETAERPDLLQLDVIVPLEAGSDALVEAGAVAERLRALLRARRLRVEVERTPDDGAAGHTVRRLSVRAGPPSDIPS